MVVLVVAGDVLRCFDAELCLISALFIILVILQVVGDGGSHLTSHNVRFDTTTTDTFIRLNWAH